MLTPRLLRHALDHTSVDRILLSGDYPFHRIEAATVSDFLRTLPDHDDRHKIAHADAESLYGLDRPLSEAPGQAGGRADSRASAEREEQSSAPPATWVTTGLRAAGRSARTHS
ncbi:hypothetical protein [Streptomyces sp. NPDC048644]|uniref:hypothetical protein n=1 Tax=Streptomyces sp. NPDC048644 TaxID=3365582 RepID=UPI0037220DCE